MRLEGKLPISKLKRKTVFYFFFFFRNRNRHDDRMKKHRDDYYGSSNSHDGMNNSRDRHNSLNSPSTPSSRGMHPTGSNPRLTPAGAVPPSSYEGRGTSSPYVDTPGGPGGGGDRWGHGRDR